MTKRRHVLTGGLIGAGLAACSTRGTADAPVDPVFGQPVSSQPVSSQPVSSQPVVNWRMATSWPRFLAVFEGLDLLCRRVSDLTAGRFTITPYAGGELAAPLEVFDAVAAGKAECCHTALYYYMDKSPALAFGTAVPFGFDTQQQNAWLYGGGGIQAIQEILDDFGLVWFPAGNTTGQMGGWFRKPIDTAADLQGLTMRIPGLGGQVLSRLGVTTTALAAQDIVPALLEGTIDAVEWIGPSEDRTLGLQKVAPYYYYPGWWEPATSFAALINQEQWVQLPPAYQAVFKTAAAEANLAVLAKYNANNQQALERFRLGGVETRPFSQEILTTCRQTSLDIYGELAAADTTFRTVYDQWQGFRDRIYRWHRVSALSFSQFAYDTV